MTPMQHPVELSAAFRASGLKLTPQRQLLFKLLHQSSSHPSAEALYVAASQQMPGISLRTVYQTLSDLVTMGELQQLTLDSGSARFDPNVGDHHHVVCERCGEVRDVYVNGVEHVEVDGLEDFRIDATNIVFRGRCARCVDAATPGDSSTTHQATITGDNT
jgi:Fe2+ or Zn2+ uptake regulation protein